MTKVKNWLLDHHAVYLIYVPIYVICFEFLEKRVTTFHIINIAFDSKLPFLEIFVVPYMFWFVFIFAGGLYFFLKEPDNFKPLMKNLILGMSVSLVICFVYPNGLTIRPTVFPRDNIFTDVVKWLYATDTPTNVFPSVHVANSLAMFAAIWRSEKLTRKHRGIQFASLVVTILIILSTMLIKQHSVLDVTGALIMGYVNYAIVYGHWPKISFQRKEKLVPVSSKSHL